MLKLLNYDNSLLEISQQCQQKSTNIQGFNCILQHYSTIFPLKFRRFSIETRQLKIGIL